MEVDEDVRRVEHLQDGVGAVEGILEHVQIEQSLQIDDRDLRAAHVEDGHAASGAGLAVVRGAQDVLVLVDVQVGAALERVVPGGDDVRAGLEDAPGGVGGDPVAVRGVLPVDDRDVDAVLPLDRAEPVLEELASHVPDHITDK